VPVAEPPERAAPERPPQNGELWSLVRELPPKQRAAVAHRFAADLSYRDVGEAMGTSEEAARRNVHEGLRALRRHGEALRA
jgi:RNA polymerase sigma factor (sigma-70 family)